MSLPVNKPCLFCGGRYAKLNLGKGFEEHHASTLMIGKTGETGVIMAKCNLQMFDLWEYSIVP